jgi:hypothetical protein
VSLFAYPKTRHTRTQNPPRFENYRSYKPFLRTEFEGRCVYCEHPDAIKGIASFGADHYRPKRHFPSLENEYLNLYYCCNSCNSRKGSYWPKPEVEATAFVPNPCEHEMFAHLRYNGAVVEAKSDAGKFSVYLLDLNGEVVVGWRAGVLSAVAALRAQGARILSVRRSVDRRSKAGTLTQAEADEIRSQLNDEVIQVNQGLALFGEHPFQ